MALIVRDAFVMVTASTTAIEKKGALCSETPFAD
jgi:hypothetical protein